MLASASSIDSNTACPNIVHHHRLQNAKTGPAGVPRINNDVATVDGLKECVIYVPSLRAEARNDSIVCNGHRVSAITVLHTIPSHEFLKRRDDVRTAPPRKFYVRRTLRCWGLGIEPSEYVLHLRRHLGILGCQISDLSFQDRHFFPLSVALAVPHI